MLLWGSTDIYHMFIMSYRHGYAKNATSWMSEIETSLIGMLIGFYVEDLHMALMDNGFMLLVYRAVHSVRSAKFQDMLQLLCHTKA